MVYQIDTQGVAETEPARTTIGDNPGFFTSGNPSTGTPATRPGHEFFNMVMKEFLNIVTTAGLTPDKADDTQLTQAVNALISANSPSATLGASFIDGLTFKQNTATPTSKIDIQPGKAQSASTNHVLSLDSVLIKTTGAFAEGDDAGGLFSGSIAADTSYHIHLIRKTSDGTIDAGFSTSPSAADIPAGYAGYRRIGSFRTDGSANIKDFMVHETAGGGIQFRYVRPIRSVNAYALTYGSAHVHNIDTPQGIRTKADLVVFGQGGDVRVYVTSMDESDIDGVATDTDLLNAARLSSPSAAVPDAVGSQIQVMTDTSRQIRTRSGYASGTITLTIATYGWLDERRVA